MGLTETIEEAVKDFEKRKNKQDVWEQLKKKLKKTGFKDKCDRIIDELGSEGAYEFLDVWNALDEHLNKHEYKWNSSDGSNNLKSIKRLSEIEGIKEIIKVLGDIGYELPSFKGEFDIFINLSGDNLQIFNTLAQNKIYKEYAVILKALKRLGYENIKSYVTSASTQLEFLTRIASLGNDAAGAMYVLASNGYRIDKVTGLNRLDLKSIEKIAEEGRKEKPENGIPVYLYKKGNVEIFQEYFNNLEVEKKKSIMKSILNYETKEEHKEPNNQIRDWLEKEYESLLREVGFED